MKNKWAFTLIELMVVMALIALLAAILIPNFNRARAKSQLEACRTNLKSIAQALEIYSSENQAHYPPSIMLLTPNFLKSFPECPAVSAPTYIGSYASASQPDIFTIYCQSAAHVTYNISPNYPQWHSISGVQDK